MSSHQTIQFDELRGWLSENRVSIRELSRRTKIDKSKLSRLLNGKSRIVDLALIAAIDRETQNAVGSKEFMAFFDRLNGCSPHCEAAA